MLEYDTGVPSCVVISMSITVGGIIFVLFRKSKTYSCFFRKASWCIIAGYIYFLLCSTVLFREPSIERHFIIQPFWSYFVLYNKLLAQNILNVLMFMPIGFFTGIGLRKKKTMKVVLIGFVLSLAIEITQLITKCGIFSTDDVIHNTIGCLIGYGLFRLFYMMKPWLQWKLKTT
jgi:glycopeptide antibiotics resistance protein